MIIEAIREKDYSRLMHYLGIMFEVEERKEARYWNKIAKIDDDVAYDMANKSCKKPPPYVGERQLDE